MVEDLSITLKIMLIKLQSYGLSFLVMISQILKNVNFDIRCYIVSTSSAISKRKKFLYFTSLTFLPSTSQYKDCYPLFQPDLI